MKIFKYLKIFPDTRVPGCRDVVSIVGGRHLVANKITNYLIIQLIDLESIRQTLTI